MKMKYIRGIIEEGPALPPGVADEVSRAIEHVLQALPRHQREIAEHRLRHQRTTAEIARRMGVSSRTIAQHLDTITEVLRAELPALLH